ncbi:DUF378 domain-containing protein [Patescibacteria group bacterium]|nr:DUF378 domain-containing protein [Patescibacteria group bacterium]
MKYVHTVAFVLVVIGALNWGLLAVTGWELGNLFGGMDASMSKIMYVLVALSAVYLLLEHKKTCRLCVTEEKKA